MRHGLDAVVFIGVGVFVRLTVAGSGHFRHALGGVVAVVHRLTGGIRHAGQRAVVGVHRLRNGVSTRVLGGSGEVAVGGVRGFRANVRIGAVRRTSGKHPIIQTAAGGGVAIAVVGVVVRLMHRGSGTQQQMLLLFRVASAVIEPVLIVPYGRITAGLRVYVDDLCGIVLDIGLLTGQRASGHEVLVAVVSEAFAKRFTIQEEVRKLGHVAVVQIRNGHFNLRIVVGRCGGKACELPADPLAVEIVRNVVAPGTAALLESKQQRQTAFHLGFRAKGYAPAVHPAAQGKQVAGLTGQIHRLHKADIGLIGHALNGEVFAGQRVRERRIVAAVMHAGYTGGQYVARLRSIQRKNLRTAGGSISEVAVGQKVHMVHHAAFFQLRAGKPRRAVIQRAFSRAIDAGASDAIQRVALFAQPDVRSEDPVDVLAFGVRRKRVLLSAFQRHFLPIQAAAAVGGELHGGGVQAGDGCVLYRGSGCNPIIGEIRMPQDVYHGAPQRGFGGGLVLNAAVELGESGIPSLSPRM